MKLKYFLLIVVALTALWGCATSYKSKGFTGGFSELQLAPDVFRVTFNGNAYTSGERAQDFAMLRAAELALQNGFGYFAIVDAHNTVRTESFTTPGQATSTGTLSVYGNQAYYSGQSTYTPGQTTTFFKPKTGMVVQCFRTKPDGINAFDAAFLQQSVKQAYNIK